MARAGINKALVQRACDGLLARGVHPSIEAVRSELGNTGSKTTIQRYLKELNDRSPSAHAGNLNDELQAYISSLAERLTEHALAAVAEDRARFQRQQEGFTRQRIAEQARLQQIQLAYESMAVERRESLERERSLNERLQVSDCERERLREVGAGLQQRLIEHVSQIQSLEEKHLHSRHSLEHYREHQILQREQEQCRHAAQVHELQHECHSLQKQVLAKQEETTQLYRELERLTSEQRNQGVLVRTSERELQQLRAQIQNLRAEGEKEHQQVLTCSVELAASREKAKRYLLMHRQDGKDLKMQAQQIHDLRNLLAHHDNSQPKA